MLVEFVARNFRSIRGEVRLSMEAGEGLTAHPDAVVEVGPPGADRPPLRLLRSVALYGPNNAGKSNLLAGLRAMLACLADRSRSEDTGSALARSIRPWLLDADAARSPTVFEVTVALEGSVYRYGFAADRTDIHREWLYVAGPGGASEQPWLLRSSDRANEALWELKGGLSQFPIGALEEGFSEDRLFLSTAADFRIKSLAPLTDWLFKRVVFFRSGSAFHQPTRLTRSRMAHDPQFGRWLQDELRAADVGIDTLELVGPDNRRSGGQPESVLPGLEAVVAEGSSDPDRTYLLGTRGRLKVPRVVSGAPDGTTVDFDLVANESEGTQQLVVLLTQLHRVLQRGGLFVVDELETSLHVLQVKRLIERMRDPVFNPHGAQLLFTTHQALLLDPAVLREDQVYLVGADADGATGLSSLFEFDLREGEPWCQGYLNGRYGGVPLFGGRRGAEAPGA